MARIPFFFLGGLFLTCPLNGDGQDAAKADSTGFILTPEMRQSLSDAQTAMFATFTAGDTAAFVRFTGEDYVTINADGTLMNKAEATGLVLKLQGADAEVVSQDDRFYGPLAISTGRAKFRYGSFLVADVFFTQIWIFRDQSWQYIGWHGTMTGWPTWYPQITLVLLLLFGSMLIRSIIRRLRRKSGREDRRT